MSVVTEIKDALIDEYKCKVELRPSNKLDEGDFIITLSSFSAEIDDNKSYILDLELSILFRSRGIDDTIDKLMAYIPLIDNSVSRNIRYKVTNSELVFDTGETYIVDLRLSYSEVLDV